MNSFLDAWGEAALTSLGFFWMAMWAFALGYAISAMIQVFVTRERMQRAMGDSGPRSVALGAFFGFISSSCSFAALSTTRALFQKGSGLAPALAFLLASTNLVIELGILIFVFLSWHFVVGEYLGGVLLILVMWLVVRLTAPKALVEAAREHAKQQSGRHDHGGGDDGDDWRQRIRSRDGWRRVGRRYVMEWGMVWKDVLIGFTAAGVIASFVPASFFQTLFIGSGGETDPAWWQIVLHTLIGPIAAFFTFIGSMGNIPLAAVLFGSGVSFAGIMAFIFSDLIVFPVLRVCGRYFGWRMAAYILGVFLISLVTTSLMLHYGFAAAGMLPDEAVSAKSRVEPADRFGVDYTLFLNLAFAVVTGVLLWLRRAPGRDDSQSDHDHDHDDHDHNDKDEDGVNLVQQVLWVLSVISLVWLAGGAAWRLFSS